MEIIIVEFLCCGENFRSDELNAEFNQLLHEGIAMASALANDLLRGDSFTPIILWNAKHGSPPASIANFAHSIASLDEWLAQVPIGSDSVIYLIAPEIENHLPNMAEKIELSNRRLLGTRSGDLVAATDKLKVAGQMKEIGVTMPVSYAAGDDQWRTHSEIERWVLKPTHGAGCYGVEAHRSSQLADRLLQLESPDCYMLQEFIVGEYGSFCAIANDELLFWMPPCQQLVEDGKFQQGFSPAYLGGITNAFDFNPSQLQEQLSKYIREYQSQLRGWVGFDFVTTPGGEVFVLEMNPRLTTSFVGLSRLSDAPLGEYLCKLMCFGEADCLPLMNLETQIRFRADGDIEDSVVPS